MADKKIRVLALFDYACSTGFATVSSNVMQELHKTGRYDLDVIGVNFTGDPYDEQRFPGRVFPAMTYENIGLQDPYGRQKFFNLLAQDVYDVVYIIQDTFVIQGMIPSLKKMYEKLNKKFKVVFYFPFDSVPKKDWIEQCVSEVDFPVTYTEWAKSEAVKVDPKLQDRLEVIYHGTNHKEFFYKEDRKEVDEFRRKFFGGKADGKFLITNINRNQPRKDILRSLAVLRELKDRDKDVVLYLHMAHDDAGGNILVMADHFGLKNGEDFLLPSPQIFEANRGMPVSMVNGILNASDCLLTTTYGEGWGLSVTEAMATRTPVVAPDNTSLSEILADNRGKLVPSGVGKSDYVMLPNDMERMRPIIDVDAAADKVIEIMDGNLPDLDAAQEFVQRYSWEFVCKRWVHMIDQAAKASAEASNSRAERRRRDREEQKAEKKAAKRGSIPV